MTKPNSDEVQIRFRRGVDNAGFSSSTTSNVANAEATTIIRELIQNSVDAAKSIKRSKTVIRFEVDEVDSSELPGFSNVKEAFKYAVEAQKKLNGGNLPDVQQEIVDGFRENLKKKRCSVLSVKDNGIGLTEDTMNALLSDGRSAKSSEGSGAHGYGHLTVLPSSGIRLVYYGGVSGSGVKVAAGHCVLASFKDGDVSKTKDGYLVHDVTEDMFNPYRFLNDDDIPTLISSKLDMICNEWKTGTVVQVPFFNYFRSPENELWKQIKKAAATNFFASFYKDEIVIEYMRDGKTESLSRENIEDVLEEFSVEKNTRSFIAGAKALDCYNVIKEGKKVELKTEIGTVSAVLARGGEAKSSRIDLCRNGMWIVHNNSPGKQLAKLQSASFEGFERFHLVLLLDANDRELHRLIRNAEPPLHDAVDVKRLHRPESRKKLTDAFLSIRSEIKKHLTELDDDDVILNDIMAIPLAGGHGSGDDGGSGSGGWRRIDSSNARKGPMEGRDGPGGGNRVNPHNPGGRRTGGGGTTKRAKGSPSPFGATSVPLGPRSYKFEIHPNENMERGNLKFKIDRNIDETCRLTNTETNMQLTNIKVDGKSVERSLVFANGSSKVEGIQLDNLEVDKKVVVQFDFELSDSLNIPNDQVVGLEVEIIKGSKKKETVE